jgi:hypothetical protein
VALIASLLAGCHSSDPDVVRAERYDSFWLWAGVKPSDALRQARTVYLLDGERLERGQGRYEPRRAGIPRLPSTNVWLVVRTDTLDWPVGAADDLAVRAERWANGGSRMVGVQLDFDARTRHLDQYAAFLANVRKRLPRRYLLSITGLLDWSANGDPKALAALAGTVDEVVIQTYQGRRTIPGYEPYLKQLAGFPIPFKVGLVEGGRWVEPPGLADDPKFKGYVVFLTDKS